MTKPSLKGKRIVITRSVTAGREWAAHLRKNGAIVHAFPTIQTSPAEPTEKIKEVLSRLPDFGWIVFTSAEGPTALLALMKKMRITMPVRKEMPMIAVIGEATARAVRGIGCAAAFMPKVSDSATLAHTLSPLRSPILLLRADIASNELPGALRARGVRVTDLSVYTTTMIQKSADVRFSKLLGDKKIDFLTFASPSSVQGFLGRMKGTDMKTAQEVPVVAIGPKTALAARRAGFRNIRTAKAPTALAVADAIRVRSRYTG